MNNIEKELNSIINDLTNFRNKHFSDKKRKEKELQEKRAKVRSDFMQSVVLPLMAESDEVLLSLGYTFEEPRMIKFPQGTTTDDYEKVMSRWPQLNWGSPLHWQKQLDELLRNIE